MPRYCFVLPSSMSSSTRRAMRYCHHTPTNPDNRGAEGTARWRIPGEEGSTRRLLRAVVVTCRRSQRRAALLVRACAMLSLFQAASIAAMRCLPASAEWRYLLAMPPLKAERLCWRCLEAVLLCHACSRQRAERCCRYRPSLRMPEPGRIAY